jgi:hypothetical protein
LPFASTSPPPFRNGVADPSGPVSATISVYDLIGVDTKLSLTKDGFSACFGAGFGVGGTAVGFDPFGDLDDDKIALELSLKGQYGPAKLELGTEISECRKVKPKGELCVGVACTKLEKDAKGKANLGLKTKPGDLQPSDLISSGGDGITAKVAGKVCQAVK